MKRGESDRQRTDKRTALRKLDIQKRSPCVQSRLVTPFTAPPPPPSLPWASSKRGRIKIGDPEGGSRCTGGFGSLCRCETWATKNETNPTFGCGVEAHWPCARCRGWIKHEAVGRRARLRAGGRWLRLDVVSGKEASWDGKTSVEATGSTGQLHGDIPPLQYARQVQQSSETF